MAFSDHVFQPGSNPRDGLSCGKCGRVSGWYWHIEPDPEPAAGGVSVSADRVTPSPFSPALEGFQVLLLAGAAGRGETPAGILAAVDGSDANADPAASEGMNPTREILKWVLGRRSVYTMSEDVERDARLLLDT